MTNTPWTIGHDAVAHAAARFSPCLKAIRCLLALDSTLRLDRERLRLRLLVVRLIGPVSTADVGNELRTLQRLHARGFPVPAMDVERDFRADPPTAIAAIVSFRQRARQSLADPAAEAAHVTQVVFMEPFGRTVDLVRLAAMTPGVAGLEPWTDLSALTSDAG